MNKIYKLIWSKTKNCWVVASELANSHAKSASGRVKGSVLAASVLTVLLGSALFPMDAVYAADPVADGQTHYVSVGVKQGEKIKVRKNVYDTNGHFLRVEEEEVEINPTENYNPPANPSVNFIGIGADLSQYGNGSVGVGFKTGAAEYGTALGTNARAGSLGDVAIGWQAFTSGYVGATGQYTAPNKIAIGTQSTALEENGISIGTKSKTLGKNSITIGNEAETSSEGDQKDGNASIAIGNKAKIQGQHNVAIGSGVTVGVGEKDSASSYVVAIGSDSHAYDTDSVVIGGHSEVRENGVVVGNYSKAGMQSVALGSDIEAGEWSIAIGLSSKAKNYAIAMGHSSEASAADSVAFGNNASAKGIGAIAIGSENDVTNGGAQAYSGDTIAIGRRAVAGNEDDTATVYNTVAIGREARAYGKNSVALGGTANVGDIWQKKLADGGTAVGSSANAALENATALGYKSIAYGKDAVTLGANTRADIADGVALGSESQVKDDYFGGKVGKEGYDPLRQNLDTSVWKSTKAAVSVGDRDKNITRQIINVAAGSEGTDAVNVAQLQGLEQKAWNDLTAVKNDLGARIQTNAGNIRNLSTKVDGNTANINNLKQQRLTDIDNINQSIEGHTTRFVSVNRENTGKKSDNYLNDGATKIGSIAIGHNAHADGEQAVTLGYNSFSKGQGSVVIGETSRNSTGGFAAKKGQFDQSIVVGSQNEVYAKNADLGGREDTILGSKNNITESHGTFVRGVGNYVADAYNDEVMTADEKKQLEGYLRDNEGAPESPIGLFEKERSHVTVDGDGNSVAGAIYTRVSGVSNEISSSNDKPKSSYNIVTGNRNTLGDSSHNLIMGDNHELNDVNGNIIIGSLKTKAKTEASNVTILGNDANVSVNGGVALGTDSVADTDAGVFGYDPVTGEASTTDNAAWKSGNGAVSVGTADKTRQITNLAAGMADTDAVNVAQLKAIKQKIDNGAIHYFSVNSTNKDADSNYENDGAKGTDAVAIGSSAKAQREFATAVGAKTAAAGKGANAYGGGIAAGEGTVAIGQNAVAALKSGITQEEYDALKNYQKALYISDNKGLYYQYRYQRGKIARDEQNYNVAIGSGAESYANQTLSLGYKAKSDVDGGVAIGAESSANRQAGGIGYIATGSSATFEDALTTLNKKEDYDKWTATVDDSKKEYDKLTRNFDIARTNERKAEAKAALDAWKKDHADFVEALAKKEQLEATWKGTKGAVSVGKDEINEAGNRVIASRQITHVAAGTEDTDAVNVAQLKTAKTTVEAGDYVTVEKGTKEGTDGTIYTVTGPTLSIDGGNLTVADDEKDGKKVGYKLSLNKTLTGLESVTSEAFKVGNKTYINKDGINANGDKITNVKDGDVSETSTDAVNGKQLNEVKTKVETNEENITELQKGWTLADSDANKKIVKADNTVTVTGDDYINATVSDAGLKLGMNETKLNDQINNQIDNSETVTNKMNSWVLKATSDEGAAAEGQKIDNKENAVTFDATGDGLSVKRNGSTITYGIDGSQIDLDGNTSITNLSNEIEKSKIHYFSVKDLEGHLKSNYNNDGAKKGGGIAIGQNAQSNGWYSIAAGLDSKVTGNWNIAIGVEANVTAKEVSTAIGYKASVTKDGAMAFGKEAQTEAENGISIGTKAKSLANRGIAVGTNSTVDQTGGRGIAIGDGSYVGAKTQARPGTGMPNPGDAWNPSEPYLPVADDTVAEPGKLARENSMAIGMKASAFGFQTTALGAGAEAHDTNTTALGVAAVAKGNYSTALGKQARTFEKESTSVGHWADSRAEFATALGSNTIVYKKGGVALGFGARAYDENSIAIGSNSFAKEAIDGKAYLSDEEVKAAAGIVSVGNPAYKVGDKDFAANYRRIVNVAGGINDNDAVNVAQLKALAGKVTANADNITKGWVLKATSDTGEEEKGKTINNTDNEVTFDVEKDQGLTVERDGSTIKYGIDGSKIDIKENDTVKKLEKDIENSKTTVKAGNENISVVKANDKNEYTITLAEDLKGLKSISGETVNATTVNASDKVTVGDNVTINNEGLTIKDGPSVTTKGIDAGNKAITNVVDGKADTDAVNVRQLNALANQSNQNIAILGGKVGELGNRVNRVGAGAAALAALHPLDFDPDDKWDFAAGYGNYKGANAAAIGAYYRPNEDTMVSVGGSFGGGENMVNAGVSVKLGQGNHVTTSRVAMAKEIKDLRAEVEVLRQAVTGIGQGQTPDPVKMKLFPDIAKNHWAYEAVEELTKQGLLEGYPDGTFGGDRMMTRYEFAEIVYRAMQKGLNVNERLIQEFEPELERFRIDVISKDKNGNPVIERVRVNKKADTAKMANA